VRVKDIAKQLKVKNSSVTVALRTLASKGYINYEPYGIISLTEKGHEVSKKITEKHRTLTYFFSNILSLDKNLSEDIASKMEYVLSEEAFNKFKCYIEFFLQWQEANPNWINEFDTFCKKKQNQISD
jgi:DtxR family Mn-dependent transcriptional regulator